MAKESKSLSFKNAKIEVDGDVLTITETGKDFTNVYNLTDKLKEFENIEGLTLSIKKDIELPSEE